MRLLVGSLENRRALVIICYKVWNFILPLGSNSLDYIVSKKAPHSFCILCADDWGAFFVSCAYEWGD